MLRNELVFLNRGKTKSFSQLFKIVLCVFGLIVLASVFSIEPVRSADVSMPIGSDNQVATADSDSENVESLEKTNDVETSDADDQMNLIEYTIRDGDTLSEVFISLDLPYENFQRILEADAEQLSIDSLQVGNILRFWLNKDSYQVDKFELEFNLLSKIHFHRQPDETYLLEQITLKGKSRDSVIVGEIYQSFSVSAKRAGLAYSEVQTVTNLFKERINFSRDLRPGDQFDVVRSEQFIDGQPTGIRILKAVRMERKGRLYTAYLHQDGHYYDQDGNSLNRAFQRFPTPKKSRITSHFNLGRKHPVTGKFTPHTGTDFAAKTGSPVVTTADGVVAMVRNHPYAGKYVVIDHGNQYRTRYMHNSKILVKKGQAVERGELIALSGKTGRVTGPHIHYELLVNGRAVDPMKAKIPVARGVPLKERGQFRRQVNRMNAMMKTARNQISQMQE